MRSRGERRSLRTLPGVSLLPPLAFKPRPRRLSTPSDAYELHPAIALYGTTLELDGGATLECDVIVVGIGAGAPIEPFARLAAAPAPTGGIAVDGTFAASGEGIEPKSVYAIGDVAAFPLKRAGGALRRVLLHTGPHTTASAW